MALSDGTTRLVSCSAAPFKRDPNVAYVVFVRPAEEDPSTGTASPVGFAGMIARSPAMTRLSRLVDKLQASDATILLTHAAALLVSFPNGISIDPKPLTRESAGDSDACFGVKSGPPARPDGGDVAEGYRTAFAGTDDDPFRVLRIANEPARLDQHLLIVRIERAGRELRVRLLNHPDDRRGWPSPSRSLM
jgi:hypothetical protein